MSSPGVLRYGSVLINYELEIRPRRKSLGIEVHPAGRVVVLAPAGLSDLRLQEMLDHRASWIHRKIEEYKSLRPASVSPDWRGGGALRFLGRQYRIRAIKDDSAPLSVVVSLGRTEMQVVSLRRLRTEEVNGAVERWLIGQARAIFQQVLDKFVARSAFRKRARPRLRLCSMRRRWGSLSPLGNLTLNTRLVHEPVRCIEYVVCHELCHLVHANHGREFMRLLHREMPDWNARKRRLESASS